MMLTYLKNLNKMHICKNSKAYTMNLQVSVNILQNRGWTLVHKSSANCLYINDDYYLVVPVKNTTKVPAGTLDALFRSAYIRKASCCFTDQEQLTPVPVVAVILEKQEKQIWGRIERQGVLAVSYANTREEVAEQLGVALTEFMQYADTQKPGLKWLPEGFAFDYQHDLTMVREFFRHVRPSYLSEQTGISQELLSEFMTNKKYPTTLQAKQIEALIQKFGREMLKFSLI